ncbi:hypothetical protein LSCM1_01167 [Leishmania martiniquensis]|uniref:J domain-containing protein n=1 Tax=Leishmania martiniquensis TaxID=1580590 RepID=A0A836G7P4_9TRYP|nr:hypothetical protein LSCM1_01167 [Leishmania martiniquensis]
MLKDYYAILDVLPRASGEEIRRAFKRLALQFHPDKIGGDAAAEVASTAHTDEHGLTTSRADTLSATAETARLDAVSTSRQLRARDFTDIQEAYEVLGDVARRYLYDMNYNELLALQQQRQEEEQHRCDAHARTVAEAVRRVQERERLRQQQQQQQNHQPHHTDTFSAADSSSTSAGLRTNALGSSLLQYTPLPARGKEEEATGASLLPVLSGDAVQSKQGRQKLEPAEERGDSWSIEDLEGRVRGDGRALGARYCSTMPTRPREDGSRDDEVRSRREGGDRDTNEFAASYQYQTRISCSGTKHARQRMAATAPPACVLAGPVTFSWGDAATQTCPSVSVRGRSRERRWHRHAPPRDGEETAEPERPLEYYYQRSIERTLRVFFGVPHLE